MSKVIVLSVKPYSFENERKEIVSGARVNYLPSSKSTSNTEVGYTPLQSNVSLEVLKSLTEIPGLYNANYDMVAGKGNKPILKLIDFELINSVSFDNLF